MSEPRPYDLTDPEERQRLWREVRGYLSANMSATRAGEPGVPGCHEELDLVSAIVENGHDNGGVRHLMRRCARHVLSYDGMDWIGRVHAASALYHALAAGLEPTRGLPKSDSGPDEALDP